MKAFSRDKSIKQRLPVIPHHEKDDIPLNGVLPHKNLSTLCLPLFYIYTVNSSLHRI